MYAREFLNLATKVTPRQIDTTVKRDDEFKADNAETVSYWI